MTENILTTVKLDIPFDRPTLKRVVEVLQDFELSHCSPSATHFDGPAGTMFYSFESPGDAIYFGNHLKPVTPITDTSREHFRRITTS